MTTTKVLEAMTASPKVISPDETIVEAARLMRDIGCGILPVGNGPDDLVGVITDRDIVVRALAQAKDITTAKVDDYMTERVITCNENDSLEIAADKMHIHQVSRLIVKNLKGEISGIISFGNILRKDPDIGELTRVIQHAVRPRPSLSS